MNSDIASNRRTALRKLGLALLGIWAWPAKGNSKLFVSQFLEDQKPVQLPVGYYNPETQLYHDAKTHEPVFLADTGGEKDGSGERKQLTDQELADLLRSGRFVDVGKDDKVRAAMGGWGTLSRQTTLSTTRCCPIVTDSESDTGIDDTPDHAP